MTPGSNACIPCATVDKGTAQSLIGNRHRAGWVGGAAPRSLLEHGQHISHTQGLKTTRSGLPPSFR